LLIKDIIQKFASGEITYIQARAELKKLSLDPDDLEDLEITIERIRDATRTSPQHGSDVEDINHLELLQLLPCVPDQLHDFIMFSTMKAISSGKYPQDVIEMLQETFCLNHLLAAYFFSEAESRVRMKTLNEEEFEAVGQQWATLKQQEAQERVQEMLQSKIARVLMLKKRDEDEDDE
jgi:hypothetical protein